MGNISIPLEVVKIMKIVIIKFLYLTLKLHVHKIAMKKQETDYVIMEFANVTKDILKMIVCLKYTVLQIVTQTEFVKTMEFALVIQDFQVIYVILLLTVL